MYVFDVTGCMVYLMSPFRPSNVPGRDYERLVNQDLRPKIAYQIPYKDVAHDVELEIGAASAISTVNILK
jgi:hypothetical protein